jgi:hypothetical protein
LRIIAGSLGWWVVARRVLRQKRPAKSAALEAFFCGIAFVPDCGRMLGLVLAFPALTDFRSNVPNSDRYKSLDMQKTSIPRCPRCLDGGSVQLVEVSDDASAVFEPLPEGWKGREFRCECGWSQPLGKSKDEKPTAVGQ